ncbi:MAG: outer membrane beta-barrel protein [Ignavibacteriales bacterium]|nr:outer membrane beta-barrel protein [Ignavibacteriales bacterium]
MVIFTAIIFLGLLPFQLHAQEGKWSVSGSAGYGILSTKDVDDKNSRDVQGYNDSGLPIDDIPKLSAAPVYAAKVSYRYTREFGFSLSVLYTAKEVSTEYKGSDDYLSLKRSIGSTDVSLGLLFYPAAQPYFLKWYVQADMGVLFATAKAETFGTHTYKVNGQPDVQPTIDTKGTYNKSKLDVAARIGADIPLVQNFFLRAEGGYRLAVLGKLEGSVSRLDGTTTSVESTVDFNYSGFLVSVGVGIEF